MSCCGRKNKMPPISKQINNFLLSVANVVAHARKSGKIIADTQTIGSRIAICNKCRHLVQTRCSVCGCFITVKAGLKAENCPLKNW